MKNKTTAALLAFFFGGIGAHLFYLRKPIRGVIYIVIFLVCCFMQLLEIRQPILGFSPYLGIVGLMALIDCIQIVGTNERDFNVEYNGGAGNEATINTADEIKKMYDLKESGAITESEYEAKKKELLNTKG